MKKTEKSEFEKQTNKVRELFLKKPSKHWPISEIAKEEYRDALDWKKSPTSYVGHFVSLKNNKRGEPVLTIFCHNRGETGKFRAFNPVLGTLRSVTLA